MADIVQVIRGRWISDPSGGGKISPGTILDADHPAVKANPGSVRPVRGRARAVREEVTSEDPPEAVVPAEGRTDRLWDGTYDDRDADTAVDTEADADED